MTGPTSSLFGSSRRPPRFRSRNAGSPSGDLGCLRLWLAAARRRAASSVAEARERLVRADAPALGRERLSFR
jgi:hypothetical protein